MLKNQLNNLSNLADKAIDDDELEQVTGGSRLEKKCPYCNQSIPITAAVCSYCNQPLV